MVNWEGYANANQSTNCNQNHIKWAMLDFLKVGEGKVTDFERTRRKTNRKTRRII